MRRGAVFTESLLADDPRIASSVRLWSLHLTSLDRSGGRPSHSSQLEIEDASIGVTVEAAIGRAWPRPQPEQLEQDLGVWRTQIFCWKACRSGCYLSLQVDDGISSRPVGPLHGPGMDDRPGQIVSLTRVVAVARADVKDGDPGRVLTSNIAGLARRLGW